MTIPNVLCIYSLDSNGPLAMTPTSLECSKFNKYITELYQSDG